MNNSKKTGDLSIIDQMKKFAVKSMLGFQTVLVYGLGRRLAIFDYLNEKGKRSSKPDEVSSVTFTLNELSQELNLDSTYLDSWIHMGIECGIFERDDSSNQSVKTGPYVYYILVDRENMFYMGDVLGGFYYQALAQETLLTNFKTGEMQSPTDFSTEIRKDTQRMSALMGKQVEKLFVQEYRDQAMNLKEGGALLEVGCGFGFNLKHWAQQYPKSTMIGIDIDSEAVEYAKQMAKENNWTDRINFFATELSEYAEAHKEEFDVVVLNQVLHEMDPSENYRKQVLKDLYSTLNDNGLLIVGESMIPGIFAPKQARYVEVMHKWFEVMIGSRFYDEDSFRKLVRLTPFETAELVQEDRDYFWALSKS
ncbi:MAG: class I SAM-dependent methyltransferase [Candidatus Heimdallarchaeota archaeon]